MKTEHLLLGGGLVALGWWLYNKQSVVTMPGVLPSRQIAPNLGLLAPGGSSSLRTGRMSADPLLPGGSGFLSGDFGYLPNVGPLNADLIAAALDANTVTDLPSSIVNPAIDPIALEFDDDGNATLNGDLLPSYTIADPAWGGLV